jgi:hypothetical protein
MASPATLRLPPLKKRSMSQLSAKAKRMGIDPAEYAKQLVEDGLAFAREAEQSSFAQIMNPVREAAGDVDDNEIISLVRTAKADYHGRSRRKKR